ncbi:MAG: hypothetical protein EOM41_08225 [Bacilli bacterium]|nr:hypothetical protein [Bacilli bacterium]
MKLFEYDDNGKKTGYFIRDKKYGVFLQNFEKKKQELREKYNVPAELSLPTEQADRIAYNQAVNDWLSDNCERRYTKEYYEAFNKLSEFTKNARDAIQFKIYELLDSTRDGNGQTHPEKLASYADKRKYKQYKIELKKLRSIYYEDGTLKQEGSVDRIIADELTELQETLAKGVHYKPNMEAFKHEKDRVERERRTGAITED